MTTETFHISAEQAEAYEKDFVPALFREWVEPVLTTVPVEPGDTVLDVACGTGVLARAAAERVGPDGAVTGVDINTAMLDVARRIAPDVEWRRGDVAALPFAAGSFDVVLCQAAVFFFPDVTGALREMGRVTRRGGRVGVQTFSSLAAQPAYGPWVEMVAEHAGRDAVDLLGTYWSAGDLDALRRRCADAGLDVAAVRDVVRPAHFADIETMVRTEVDATPLRDRIDEEQLGGILDGSQVVLARFVRDGRLVIPVAGHVVAASPT